MGTVLIHAGMPKTGSTSIQAWMRRRVASLRDAHGIHILCDPPKAGATSGLVVSESGEIVLATAYLLHYHGRMQQGADAAELEEMTAVFVDSLARHADERGTVLLSSEGFANLFVLQEAPFLRGLDALSTRHDVRIAYYVRPQHAALESRWRQWGFSTGMRPSAWVRDHEMQLRYAEAYTHTASVAPRVSFEVRPCRRDLLDGGNAVVDFARQFLRIDEPPVTMDINENPGLPLDLANLLHNAPASLVHDSVDGDDVGLHPGLRQLELGRLGRGWAIPESDTARASRAVLRQYAHRVFEPGNRMLIERLGWATESFVPPPDTDTGDLDTLDELWEPRSSPTERAYLHAALAELLRRDR